MSGNNLNYFVLEECPLPREVNLDSTLLSMIVALVSRLNLVSPRYADSLLSLKYNQVFCEPAPEERKFYTAALNTLVEKLYGLNFEDMLFILDGFDVDLKNKSNEKRFDLNLNLQAREYFQRAALDCIKRNYLHESEQVFDTGQIEMYETISGILNPKGFFRVDRDLPVFKRQTYLTLLLSKIMENLGLEDYLNYLERVLVARDNIQRGAQVRSLEESKLLLDLILMRSWSGYEHDSGSKTLI